MATRAGCAQGVHQALVFRTVSDATLDGDRDEHGPHFAILVTNADNSETSHVIAFAASRDGQQQFLAARLFTLNDSVFLAPSHSHAHTHDGYLYTPAP